MSKFPGQDWENMVRKQAEVEHRQYIEALEKREDLIVIARYIGKAGWFNHIKDKDRYWQRCLMEADGIIDDLKEAGFKIGL